MHWEFEHWDNGKVYLHNDRWKEFKKNVEKYGYQDQRHELNQNRIFLKIHTPRDYIHDHKVPGAESRKYKIENTEEWITIYDQFPAFYRSETDPEGWAPSWNLWAEDKRLRTDKNYLVILRTGDVSVEKPLMFSFEPVYNIFANFQGKIWLVEDYKHYGLGTQTPKKIIKYNKKSIRSIYEPFEPAEIWTNE